MGQHGLHLFPSSPSIFVSEKGTQVVQVHYEQEKAVPAGPQLLRKPKSIPCFGSIGGMDEMHALLRRLRALGQMSPWIVEMLEYIPDSGS